MNLLKAVKCRYYLNLTSNQSTIKLGEQCTSVAALAEGMKRNQVLFATPILLHLLLLLIPILLCVSACMGAVMLLAFHFHNSNTGIL